MGRARKNTAVKLSVQSAVRLALAAAFSMMLFAATAYADEPGAVKEVAGIERSFPSVSTQEDLIDALSDPLVQSISLGSDIALTQTMTIGRGMSIYGNGHSVTLDPSFSPGGRHFSVATNDNVVFDNIVISGFGNDVIGGGISSNGTGTITLQNQSTIERNVSAYNGGGIATTYGTVVITGKSIVRDNKALDEGIGGGVYAKSTSIEQESLVSGNSAKNGGGIGGYDNTASVDATSSVSSNHASNNGGGLVGKKLDIQGTISDNSCDYLGGGMYITGRPTEPFSIVGAKIINNRITKGTNTNETYNGGAGIWIASASGEIRNSVISGNTVPDEMGHQFGGGVYVGAGSGNDETEITIADTEIADNVSEDGAGIFVRAKTLSLDGCTLSGNKASGIGGAAVFAKRNTSNSGVDQMIVKDCSFTDNSASDGGAIAFQNADEKNLQVYDSKFTGNYASNGLIDWDATDEASLEFLGSTTTYWHNLIKAYNSLGAIEAVSPTASAFVGSQLNPFNNYDIVASKFIVYFQPTDGAWGIAPSSSVAYKAGAYSSTTIVPADSPDGKIPLGWGGETELDIPVLDGYEIEGWYKKFDENTGEYSEPFDVRTDTVHSTMELFAKWKPKQASQEKALNVARLFGSDRFGTSREVATYERASDAGDVVILASGGDENFPDALAASALSGVEGNAPVVLTANDSLSDDARAVIEEEIGAARVIIIGSTATISQAVEDEVASIPCVTSIERIGGIDRQATAEAIYESRPGEFSHTAILAIATRFPDSLTISPWAAHSQSPIFLTDWSGDTLTEKTKALLASGDFDRIIVLGDEYAVPHSAAQEARLAAGLGEGDVVRLGGDDRYGTSFEVASWVTSPSLGDDALTWDAVAFARGDQHPDALSGGALQGRDSGVLLLTPSDNPSEYASSLVRGSDGAINEMRFFGSEVAINPSVIKAFVQCVAYDRIVWKPGVEVAVEL